MFRFVLQAEFEIPEIVSGSGSEVKLNCIIGFAKEIANGIGQKFHTISGGKFNRKIKCKTVFIL